MRTVVIIQARMGSTRLPGKVLMDMAGQPMLSRVVQRASRAHKFDAFVVATSQLPEDNVIEKFCQTAKWNCFRGSQLDVLNRYVLAARQFRAEMIVRVTADCPLIDPDLIDLHIDWMQTHWHRFDIVSNVFEPSFPLGLAVEAFPREVLERMDRLSDTDYLREHVTTLAFEEPQLFRRGVVRHHENLSHLRWTVDTAQDFAACQWFFEQFGRDDFSWQEALELQKRSESLAAAEGEG